MGIDIAIHAEQLIDDHWIPVSTCIETFSIGENFIASWTESKSIYYRRDRGISRAFKAICAAVNNPQTHQHRGLPLNISNEVLNSLPPGLCRPDDPDFRQQALKAEYTSGWLRLDELINFDWSRPIRTKQANVRSEYASWFGEGDQPFPHNFPPAGFWQPGRIVQPPFWKFWAKKIPKPEYATVTWIETYVDEAGEDFINHVLPLLQTYGNAKQVRIIYWLIP